jgi:hypothetical protein
MTQARAASPHTLGRMAGLFWLLCILTSFAGVYLSLSFVVRADAAATAARITASPSLYRLGSVAGLLSGLWYLGVTIIFYYLMKPVSPRLSLTAALFGTAGVAIGSAWSVTTLIPLRLLSVPATAGFTTTQLHSMALLVLELQTDVFYVGMIFFGVQCLVLGLLIARSAFLPHALGVLLAVGGTTYVIVSLINLLAPVAGAQLVWFVAPIVLLGEGSMTVWLLWRSIDGKRWQEQSLAAAAGNASI